MSQKTKILGVKHSGAPVFLGYDRSRNPVWSSNPDRIMNWLCDGWRSRFNQHRAHRTKRRLVTDVQTGGEFWVDVPLGGPDVAEPITDAQARVQHSWLTSLPAAVLQSPQRVENTEWFAGLKRKKTAGGRVPGFKSRHRSPQQFLCWRNLGGGNAIFRKTGKRTGIVTITGMTPRAVAKPGYGSRWELQIRVRVTESIRDYTSAMVNWSNKTLVFTNPPKPIDRSTNGSYVGIDRGVTHTLATSNGEFLDISRESQERQREYLGLQRKLARQDRTNEARDGKPAKSGSKRRAKTVERMRVIASTEAKRRHDWIHQTTTKLVREHDLIALEDLRVRNMTRKGGSHKRGLNRSILRQNWSSFLGALQYKANLAGVEIVLVNPAYTSQTCNACGHVARENRESQAILRCQKCGHEANADTNAALNILERGLQDTGQEVGLGRGGKIRPALASAAAGTPDEASTPALSGGQ